MGRGGEVHHLRADRWITFFLPRAQDVQHNYSIGRWWEARRAWRGRVPALLQARVSAATSCPHVWRVAGAERCGDVLGEGGAVIVGGEEGTEVLGESWEGRN